MKNSIVDLGAYLQTFATIFPSHAGEDPWNIPPQLEQMLASKLDTLSGDYVIKDAVAIHRSARIEDHAIIKGPAIIAANCFIAAHAYLRGGVFLDEHVIIGPGCEIKTSIVLARSTLAHFNFAGDSIVGRNVNMEAGSVIANHYNEREQKEIAVMVKWQMHAYGLPEIRRAGRRSLKDRRQRGFISRHDPWATQHREAARVSGTMLLKAVRGGKYKVRNFVPRISYFVFRTLFAGDVV